MKIYLDNNLGVTNVEQEELTQDTIGYNILKVYIPNAVLTPYDTFTCYYGALLQNGRKVGWFAMEARTNTDADYEANYTLYKATLEQCVVSVEGKVYIGCQVLLGNSGNATLIKKNTAVVQFNVRKSVAINNDILVLDTDQTTTDVLESYKNLLENALTTYATKATTYTKTEVNSALALKADKSDTYTKAEVNNITNGLSARITANADDIDTLEGNVTTLQDDVANLKSTHNVIDLVSSYSALQSYDTSNLDIDDKIQVVADENHGGVSTVYNWNGSAWVYVGAYGTNSYTKDETYNKQEVNALLAPKVAHDGNQLKDSENNDFYPNINTNSVPNGAITTEKIEDGSITEIKLAQSVINDFKNKIKIGNVKFYGAIGDGVTDDTNAIKDCILNSDIIYFPNGKYLITDRLVISKKILIGDFLTSYNEQSTDNGIYFSGVGSFNILSSVLKNLKFIGDKTTNNKAIDGAGSSVIKECDFYNFDYAIYNINTSLINKCKIHGNNYGIDIMVDSRVIDNFFNVNSYAIYLQQGSNDNIITNNKIEWNNLGILIYDNNSNIISNNIFDRQNTYAIKITLGNKNILSSNLFRRNYVDDTPSIPQAHIFIENSSYLSILGNVTRTGNSEDDGTGVNCPSISAYMQTSSNIICVGNDWSGGVNTPNIYSYNNSNCKYYDLQNNQVLRYLGYVNSNEIVIPTSSSNTYTFNVVTDANIIHFYKLMITARTSTNSTFSYKECNVSTHLRWGVTQAVSIDETTLNSKLTLSVTISDNIVTLTITNADTNEWRVRISNVTLNNFNY